MATAISPRERARRIAILKSSLGTLRRMIDLKRSFEDSAILWAVRLSEYEGKPADLTAIEALTNFAHSTVSQNCRRLRKENRLIAAKDGKRHVQRLHPDYAEGPVPTAYYSAALKTADQLREDLNAADKLSDEPPSKKSEDKE